MEKTVMIAFRPDSELYERLLRHKKRMEKHVGIESGVPDIEISLTKLVGGLVARGLESYESTKADK